MRKLLRLCCLVILPALIVGTQGAAMCRAGTVVAWGANDYGQTNVPPTLTNAVAIATSGYHNLALRSDGTVVAWGYNGSGETNVPAGLSNVTAVAAGYYHSVALRSDGAVVAWGDNTHGQTNVPVSLSNVLAIAAGDYQNLALKRDGTIVAWGDGGGTNVPIWLRDVMAVAAGAGRSLALRADGTVVMWGAGSSSLPAGLTNVIAISEIADHNLALTGDGTIVDWGRFISPPPISNVVAIAAGWSSAASTYFGLALRSDGTVVHWNCCSSDVLDYTNVIASAGGGDNGLAIVDPSTSGKPVVVRQPLSRAAFEGSDTAFSVGVAGNQPFTYQWQVNATNVPDATNAVLKLNQLKATDAGNYRVLITNAVGSAVSSDANLVISMVGPQIVAQPTNRVVMAGTNVSFSVAAVGSLPLRYRWRVNESDIPDATNAVLTLNNVQPTNGGAYGVIVSNNYGSVPSSNVVLSVVGLPEVLNATNLNWTTDGNATWYPQATVTHDGFAAGRSGTIGNSQQSRLQTIVTGPGTLTFWWKLSSTAPDNLSVSVNGTVQTSISGFVDWQQKTIYLGSGTQTVLWVYARTASTIGGTDAGYVDEVSFVPGTTSASIATAPAGQTVFLHKNANFTGAGIGTPPLIYQWQFNGTNLPDATNPILSLTNVQFSQGGNYRLTVSNDYGGAVSTDAVLNVTMIAAWGGNTYGQTNVPPGLSNVVAVAAGSLHNLALLSNGTVVAWGNNLHGQTNVPAGLSNVIAIAAGGVSANIGGNSLALKSDGTLVGWGQVTVPDSLTNLVAVTAGTSHFLALNQAGNVFGWGQNNFNQTNVPVWLSNVVAVAAGNAHSLALRSDGTVVGWGYNFNGQATGTRLLVFPYITNGVVVLGGQVLSNVVAIAAGAQHSLALKGDGKVVVWGDGTYGQTNVPPGLSNVVAIARGGSESVTGCLAIRDNGTVVAWGYANNSSLTNVPPGLSGVVGVAAGSTHSLALVGETLPSLHAFMADPHWSAGSFSFSLPTQVGKVYALEYSDSLTGPLWRGLPLTAGTGSILTLTDTTATNVQRFYRVRQW